MEEIIDEMLAAVATELIYPALITAVTLPDICASLGSSGGQTSGPKYRAWVEANMGSWWGPDEASDLYSFRCALLHEGASQQAKRPRARFAFIRSPDVVVHRGSHILKPGDPVGIRTLDVETFCQEMAAASRSWLSKQRGTEPFDTNHARSIKLHPGGYAPLMMKGAVIT